IFKGWVVSLTLLCLILGRNDAGAFTFIVTQTNDSTKVTSLRGAIIAANFFGGYNTIVLKPKTYRLSMSGADEGQARRGDLDVRRGHLAIVVAGKGNATINATDLGDRVFQVFTNAHVMFSHLTIMGGNAGAGH